MNALLHSSLHHRKPARYTQIMYNNVSWAKIRSSLFPSYWLFTACLGGIAHTAAAPFFMVTFFDNLVGDVFDHCTATVVELARVAMASRPAATGHPSC